MKEKDGLINLLTRHPKLRYITALGLTCLSAGVFSGNTDMVLASETPTQTVASPDTEATTSPELYHSQAIHKMLLQTDSCYAQVTDSVEGDTNVLKKLDASVTVINGRNMIPVDYAKEMGYSVTLNTAKKTVTLDNGERKIVLTNGKKVMKITEDGTTTTVTMDAKMQLDKNKDYAISISAFGKAIDAPVQWDSVSKTIGINYTQTEFSKVKKIDAVTTELRYKALAGIAGGEFIDVQTFTNPVEKLSIGATVVYSSAKDKAAEKKIVAKYQSKLQKNDVVYCMNGKAYVYRIEETVNEDGISSYRDRMYNLDASFKRIEPHYADLVICAPAKIDCKSKTLVICDDLKETYTYDTKTGKWKEMKEYKILGTAEQRIRKSLNKFLKGETGKTVNVLDLDSKEVAQYCETGDDSKCKTFKIMKNAKGEPAFIVNTSSKYGFTAENVKYIQQAVERFNDIDETLIDTFVNRYGLNCVSYDVAEGGLKQRFVVSPSSMGSYEYTYEGGIVVINQTNKNIVDSVDPVYIRTEFAYAILVEPRALYLSQHFHLDVEDVVVSDPYWNKPGILNEEADKYAYAISKCKEWLSEKVLTRKEYNQWFETAEASLESYDPSYIRTWKWIDDDSNFVPEKINVFSNVRTNIKH